MRRLLASALCALSVAGCASTPLTKPQLSRLPVIPGKTASQKALNDLPPPARPVAVAVYGFTDQTGQFKPTDNGQTLSRAVSQGGSAILIKALQDAGNRKWFTIVEREQLKNLLNERQIIREMRERYLGEKDVNPTALPALLFAGVLLEGGVVSYDTNTLTGGLGARFLGIGGDVKYRQDTITVYLRAVSVRTGEVLSSVTTSKTIASLALQGDSFRYVGFKDLLEAEAGFTTNEPEQIAFQQAVEKAVNALVLDGVDLKLWNFADQTAGWPYLWRYRQERDGVMSAEAVQRAEKIERRDNARAAKAERDAKPTPGGAAANTPSTGIKPAASS